MGFALVRLEIGLGISGALQANAVHFRINCNLSVANFVRTCV